MLELQNLSEKKNRLSNCDTSSFSNTDNSFKNFVKSIKVNSFRHINGLTLTFDHPVTVITGTNKIGKTSILLLLACSFERFMKIDSTSPNGEFRPHAWKDVLYFTTHETTTKNYSYELEWRIGLDNRNGEGKRLATSRAWSGLGKKSSDTTRTNAKIRDWEVRLVDLERLLPGRSFTNALSRKVSTEEGVRVNEEIEQAFSFVFDITTVEIREVGNHINKSCFLIEPTGNDDESYSSFNAASGEEAVIYLLKDLLDSPKNSLILIDEIEAGFHPSIQRKIADIIQYVAWRDKKQFVITSHSPTLISSFPAKSRRFIEKVGDEYKTINNISHQAARSKMDSVGYPLVRCYCEDNLASFFISKILNKISNEHPQAHRLINIVTSGPIDQVKNDYERHKRNFSQYTNKIGFCAVFDGDHKEHPNFSNYFDNENEDALFLYPYDAPEKFLIRAYLAQNENAQLRSALEFNDHHSLFQHMVNLGLATTDSDALSLCYTAFESSPEYSKHSQELSVFLINVITKFSEMPE
jgi:predicted ATPase